MRLSFVLNRLPVVLDLEAASCFQNDRAVNGKVRVLEVMTVSMNRMVTAFVSSPIIPMFEVAAGKLWSSLFSLPW